MSFYLALKVIHVLAAIIAVGGNLTYSFWLARAGRDRDRLIWTLESIRRFDRAIANPAYIAILVTGVLMVVTLPWSFEQLWLALALVLYVGVAVLGIAVYAPTIRRQIAEAEHDPRSVDYARVAARGNRLGIVTTVVVVTIVVLMVTKPG